MREVVVHAVPVTQHPNDETIEGPLMCRKCTKRETGEMSGNSPRAVNQAVQKRVKNGGPAGDATDEPAPQAAPGSGRRVGGNKREGGGRAEPPKKKPAQSGAVKNTGVQQGGTKSDPATQATGKVWLGGKNRGRRKRRSRTPKPRAEIRPW